MADIFIGFTIPIILGVVKIAIDKLILLTNKSKEGFTLEGVWYSIHKNFLDQYLIEFIKIKYSKNNHIKIIIKQIRENNTICRFVGNGIKSNNQIFLLYKSIEHYDERAGAFMLQIRNRLGKSDYLVGTYLEYGTEKQAKKFKYYPIDGYKLYPMQSSNFLSNFKNEIVVRRIKNFNEAKEIVELYEK